MNDTINARRAQVVVNYNGKDITKELSDYLLDFTYTDAEPGTLDDLQINLEDKARKWSGPWSPSAGDRITAYIKTIGWDKPGEIKRLNCGTFEVDSIDFAGPPDTVSIKAVSLPVSTNVRQEKKTKAWESVTLKSIAAEIAKRAGFSLMYEAHGNPKYDRQDQTDVSDLAFLNDLCKQEGIALKVTGKKLVLFDEYVYEQKPSALTIERGVSDIISYGFSFTTQDVAYAACEVSYQPAAAKKKTSKKKDDKDKTKATATTDGSTSKDSKKKKEKSEQPKPIKVIYRPPGAPKDGPILKVSQSVGSQAEAINAARKSLREKNKEAGKATLSLMGNVGLAAGMTITIKGFGRFDGKYIIVSATHAVGGSGYTTNLEIRKVLGW
ncbi:contractile injection system protein, VgrG/Pvc8 family [Paenibacillus polymyxa]|uniref:phage late control D family protein n=1 Tax=Paenibacillus polymyxa TaxID=1406 RepID=UPI002AB42973|nr:contractile injection system protein, VgrG/Pvc8 family [Paenibacillus polymyxa]MDY7993378.1 contractile injection system protein, VgrG/Pvc8 family [Paenibacillus polymyxa]MDY8120021.1 contractile injection system protein, VgrG/Pvc8 family [Paenibacillus polymyxa]